MTAQDIQENATEKKDLAEEFDFLSDEEMRLILEDVEFHEMVEAEFGTTMPIDAGTPSDSKDMIEKNQFDQKLKKFTERILILAKEKALMKMKLKRVESAKS